MRTSRSCGNGLQVLCARRDRARQPGLSAGDQQAEAVFKKRLMVACPVTGKRFAKQRQAVRRLVQRRTPAGTRRIIRLLIEDAAHLRKRRRHFKRVALKWIQASRFKSLFSCMSFVQNRCALALVDQA